MDASTWISLVAMLGGFVTLYFALRTEIRAQYRELHKAKVEGLQEQIRLLRLVADPEYREQVEARIGELEERRAELERERGKGSHGISSRSPCGRTSMFS